MIYTMKKADTFPAQNTKQFSDRRFIYERENTAADEETLSTDERRFITSLIVLGVAMLTGILTMSFIYGG